MVLFFQIQLFKIRVCKRATNQATHSFVDLVIVQASWSALGIPTGQPKLSHPTAFPQVSTRSGQVFTSLLPGTAFAAAHYQASIFKWYFIPSTSILLSGTKWTLHQMDPSFLLNFCLAPFHLPSLFPFPPNALSSPPMLPAENVKESYTEESHSSL